MGEDLGVARVRRLTAEYHRRALGATENLVHQPQLDLAVALAAEFGAQMAGPQAALLHLFLQRRDELGALGVGEVVGVPQNEIQRLYLFTDELVHPVQLCLKLRLGLKIPGHGCPPH